jgi:phage-related baseplate assembly protein
MSSNTIDFSTLPPPAVVETLDYERILAEMKTDLARRDTAFTALVESDPAVKILEVCAYRETLLRARVNDAAKSVLLAYATASDLDNLAALYNVARKVVTPSDPDAIPPRAAIMETDSDLRRRVLLALDGLATAGARNAYIFHALSVEGVKDAAVMSSPDPGIEPGHVNVYVLSAADDGETPATLVSAVSRHLNADTVRPLTDIVTVAAGSVVPYSITASLLVFPGPDAETVCLAAIANANKYAADSFRLGRDIRRSAIIAALHAGGVQNVTLTAPATDIINTPAQCSRCTGINVAVVGTAE